MYINIKQIFAIFTYQQKKRAYVLFILMIFGMFAEMLSVGIIIPSFALIIDPEFLTKFSFLQPFVDIFGSSQNAIFYASVSLLIFVYIIKSAYLAFLSWVQISFVFNFQASLSKRLFKKYIYQNYLYHLNKNSSETIRNITTETSQMANGAVLCGITVLTEILVVTGLITFLIIVEPIAALITGFTLGSSIIIFWLLTKKHVLRWGEERQHSDGFRIKHIQQGVGGIKEIKLMGREFEFLNQYNRYNNIFAEAARKQGFLLSLPRLFIELVAIMTLGILFLFLIAQNDSISDVMPTLGLFAAAAFRLMPSINRILGNWQTLQYSTPVVNLIHDEMLLEEKEYISNVRIVNRDHDLKNEISLDNISFYYDTPDEIALDKINLSIKKGTVIGFIGESGSGKSTLIDLILGLLKPKNGQIHVDGKDIYEKISQWQSQIGYIPQNIYITDDSIRNNIALGIEEKEIDDKKINESIKLADLEDFIKSSSNGLQTILGERGARLSGGQLQRVGIARALYHNPSMLILDEATSALDSITEARVMNSIMKMKGTKTIIIVAHRLSTVERCDYLYKLNKGKITEEGTPNQVLQH